MTVLRYVLEVEKKVAKVEKRSRAEGHASPKREVADFEVEPAVARLSAEKLVCGLAPSASASTEDDAG